MSPWIPLLRSFLNANVLGTGLLKPLNPHMDDKLEPPNGRAGDSGPGQSTWHMAGTPSIFMK